MRGLAERPLWRRRVATYALAVCVVAGLGGVARAQSAASEQSGYPYHYSPPSSGPGSFAIAPRFSLLATNQLIGEDRLVMMGGGLELRFRLAGRVAFQVSLDVLHASLGSDQAPFVRNALPIAGSVLFYAFRNVDPHRLNVYGIAGMDVIGSTVKWTPVNGPVEQEFLELGGHLGAGLELRFKWFSLDADVRGLLLGRTRSGAGSLYVNQDAGLVPAMSFGVQATASAMFWF